MDEGDGLEWSQEFEVLSTPAQLRALIARVEGHLRPHAHKLKPPHPVLAAIVRLQRETDRLARTGLFNESAVPHLVELRLFDRLGAYWSRDPEWPRVLKGIVTQPDRYPHDLALLTFTQCWREQAGVPVELGPEGRGGASPDVFVVADDGSERLGVEVKVPKVLRRPQPPFSPAHADDIVSGQMVRATYKQLYRFESGMLVVGAYHQTPQQRLTVADAVKRWTSVNGRGHPRLLGIWLVSIKGVLQREEELSPNGDLPPLVLLRGGFDCAVVPNPWYTGRCQFRLPHNPQRPAV